MASAIVNLLQEAYPRSSHKFDVEFEGFIQGQLLRLTAGVEGGMKVCGGRCRD